MLILARYLYIHTNTRTRFCLFHSRMMWRLSFSSRCHLATNYPEWSVVVCCNLIWILNAGQHSPEQMDFPSALWVRSLVESSGTADSNLDSTSSEITALVRSVLRSTRLLIAVSRCLSNPQCLYFIDRQIRFSLCPASWPDECLPSTSRGPNYGGRVVDDTRLYYSCRSDRKWRW